MRGLALKGVKLLRHGLRQFMHHLLLRRILGIKLHLLLLCRCFELLSVELLREVLIQPHAVVERDELGPESVSLHRLPSPHVPVHLEVSGLCPPLLLVCKHRKPAAHFSPTDATLVDSGALHQLKLLAACNMLALRAVTCVRVLCPFSCLLGLILRSLPSVNRFVLYRGSETLPILKLALGRATALIVAEAPSHAQRLNQVSLVAYVLRVDLVLKAVLMRNLGDGLCLRQISLGVRRIFRPVSILGGLQDLCRGVGLPVFLAAHVAHKVGEPRPVCCNICHSRLL